MSGEDLKRVLKSKKVKITDLAKTLGMSQQNLSAALNVTDVKTGLIEKIAAATNISVSELFGQQVNPGEARSHIGNNVANANGLHGTANVYNGDGHIVLSASTEATKVAILEEKVKYLEMLIEEKNRLIDVLMKK